MAGYSSKFVCQQCGFAQVGWAGKCPECGTWGSLVETIEAGGSGYRSGKAKTRHSRGADIQSLSDIKALAVARIPTGISELDRVLGGGLVAGQVILLAGEPGIGKSTILLQLAEKMSHFFYVSGEESAGQLAIRAARLGIKNTGIKIIESTDIDGIIQTVKEAARTLGKTVKTVCVVVDSIQTVATGDLSGMAGSVGQVRESAFRLVRMAKENNLPVFIVGHVTKEGAVAGPAVLMHIVDTVLWFEGDRLSSLRLLRSVKNRFGPADEVGIFEMKDKGLQGVADPEKIFLSGNGKTAGSAVSCLMQGKRPLLIEVQSLVVPTRMAFPKRTAQGIAVPKLEMLLAVLIRHCGLPLYEYDVFANIAGGIKVNEPSCDLAVCISIASALYNKPVPNSLVAIGEVGLLGEIRKVFGEEKRVREAKGLGYKDVISSTRFNYLKQVLKELNLKP